LTVGRTVVVENSAGVGKLEVHRGVNPQAAVRKPQPGEYDECLHSVGLPPDTLPP
jgi:hypothetical protein